VTPRGVVGQVVIGDEWPSGPGHTPSFIGGVPSFMGTRRTRYVSFDSVASGPPGVSRVRAGLRGLLGDLAIVRAPDELAPVGLGELYPGSQLSAVGKKMAEAHQKPGLDGLTVPAAVAVT
jgi:hypothetical protein